MKAFLKSILLTLMLALSLHLISCGNEGGGTEVGNPGGVVIPSSSESGADPDLSATPTPNALNIDINNEPFSTPHAMENRHDSEN